MIVIVLFRIPCVHFTHQILDPTLHTTHYSSLRGDLSATTTTSVGRMAGSYPLGIMIIIIIIIIIIGA